MPRSFRLALLSALIAASGSPALAAPTLDLSSPNGLGSLTVGQLVTINVNLSGLPTNDFIFVLDSRVLFPAAEFAPVPDPNNSSGLTPGTVFLMDAIFGPLQRSNFNAASSLTSTAATGDFSDSSPKSAAAIGQNGVYYSFTLRAIAAGSGSIQFDPASGANQYAANDTGFNLAPLPPSSPLTFSISAAAVPEPSSILLIAIGMGGLACYSRRGPRSATSPVGR